MFECNCTPRNEREFLTVLAYKLHEFDTHTKVHRGSSIGTVSRATCARPGVFGVRALPRGGARWMHVHTDTLTRSIREYAYMAEREDVRGDEYDA